MPDTKLRVCRYCGEEFVSRKTVSGYIDECDECAERDGDVPPVRAFCNPHDSLEEGSPGIVAALAREDGRGWVWVEMREVRRIND